jgi:hypothetical protein
MGNICNHALQHDDSTKMCKIPQKAVYEYSLYHLFLLPTIAMPLLAKFLIHQELKNLRGIVRLGLWRPNRLIRLDRGESHMPDWSIDVANRWLCMIRWLHRIELLIGRLDLSLVAQSNQRSDWMLFSHQRPINLMFDQLFASTWRIFMRLLHWDSHFMRTSRGAWLSIWLLKEKMYSDTKIILIPL